MKTNILFVIFSFFTALVISFYAIPVIIKVAYIKKIYDKPGGRKTHKGHVPNLGGIAIFAAFIMSFVCWTNFSNSAQLQYFILGLILLHFMGVKDDIVSLTPYKKLAGQVISAAILVIPGKFRIVDMHGILGIYGLAPWLGIILSVFAAVLIINSFNLIDGIDGLAGGISLIIALTYSYIFFQRGMYSALIASAALSGSLISFLFYNWQPAKIFMGDAGSMSIGYLMAALSFLVVNSGVENTASFIHFNHNPAMVVAFLIIPLFDTLRVFMIRIYNRQSPFAADCNHIHHKLLKLGLSHQRATLLLCTVNLMFIALAYLLQDFNPNAVILAMLAVAGVFTAIPTWALQYMERTKRHLPQFEPSIEIISSLSTPVISKRALESEPQAAEVHLN